jgi:hypothetical protein
VPTEEANEALESVFPILSLMIKSDLLLLTDSRVVD